LLLSPKGDERKPPRLIEINRSSTTGYAPQEIAMFDVVDPEIRLEDGFDYISDLRN
jgi:hypothetical protein